MHINLFPLSLSLMSFLYTLVITCCIHSFYCILQASELRSSVAFYMDTFIAVVNHNFENTSLVLLTKRKYQVPSKTPTKVYESVPAFPWSLQATAETVP